MREWIADLTASARRIANLCRKELLAIFKDKANRIVLIAPAIVQSILFGYSATYDLTNVPYAVLDQSGGQGATELMARFEGTGVFHRVATLRTQSDIARVIDAGDAVFAVQMGPRFDDQLAAGEQAPLQIILDGRNSTTAGAALGDIAEIVAQYNAELGVAQAPLSVTARAWYNPNLETRWNILPGLIATLSMLQTLLLTALSVAREREQGTFDQLLVTPLTPPEIMIGKAVPPILVGLVQSSLILLVSLFWFKVPMAGSLLTLYAGLTLFTVASVGIGLSISAVSATMHEAMLYTFVLIMPLTLLSGLTTPVRNMPQLLQTLTLANPLRFAVDLVQRVYLEGVGLSAVWINLIPLIAIAAITLPLAAWLFRHRLV